MWWSLKDVVNTSLLIIFSELLAKNESIIVAEEETDGLLVNCLKPCISVIDSKPFFE